MSIDQKAITEDLIERILEVTHSPQSVQFYRKAISVLGAGFVEGEMAEVRYRQNTGMITDPAAYLTTLLKKHLPDGPANEQLKKGSLPQESYFSPTPQDLVSELNAGTATPSDYDGHPSHTMSKPYSGKAIPWATFVSSDFFTLSTNKNKSDEVVAKFHTMDGQVVHIPMLRGKNFPGDDARGILTVEHGRILGALEMLWSEQNTFFENFEKKISICYCDVGIRDIATLLGWKTFGGEQLRQLKKKMVDLSVMPYYLKIIDVSNDKKHPIHGYGFTFIGEVATKEKDLNGRDTSFRIVFSSTMSSQLLKRRVVTRNQSLLKHRGELAWLIRMHLESILISRDGKPYSVPLPELIEKLNLPPAGWHTHKGLRKQQFKKAIKELDGVTVMDNKVIEATIVKDLETKEYVLAAHLVGKTQLK